ncbi:MAG: sodium:calcium antiporter [Gammaproteobacteria bacterium]|nr:sodium:calcium antiporter [Gammaproteobacteria bacterium]NNL51291.1 sodium:calcium antiporter [Woeseiaceae bacterium]
MEFALLILGLAGLWFGTEVTIHGAVSIAKRYGVSEFIIGVVILSIGSDLPELAIAVDAGLKNLAGGDYSDVVVGSALGSSLGQIGFVLGFVGLLSYLTLPRGVIYRHGSTLLGSLLLVALFGYDGIVTVAEGLALILVYAIYLVALLNEVNGGAGVEQSGGLSFRRSMIYIAVGLTIVVGSAELTVSSAVDVARMLGLSDAVVAIILIGLGSSLPELTISISAVLKGHHRMSVGNLIGSNVFDTLVPIGAAAVIAPLSFDAGMLRFELPYLFFVTAAVIFFFLHRRGIQRWEAAIVLALYCAYVLVKLTGSFAG